MQQIGKIVQRAPFYIKKKLVRWLYSYLKTID